MIKRMHKVAITLFLLVVLQAQSSAEVFYKEFRKSLTVYPNVELGCDISFAQMTVTTWDQNQMEIIIKVNADVKSEKRAQELFDCVLIQEGSAKVGIQIQPKGGWKGRENVNITVEVKMPATGALLGNVAFGNVNVSSLKGRMEMQVSYGNLNVSELLSADNDVEVSFGNSTIDVFGGGKFLCQYGNLKLRRVTGSSRVNEQFGNVDINKVGGDCKSLELDCEYGNAYINAEGIGVTFDTECSFGKLEVKGEHKTTSNSKDDFNISTKGTSGNGGVTMDLDCSFGNIDLRL